MIPVLVEPVLEKLATSDRITIAIEHLKTGNMRVTSNSWDHERVLLGSQVLEVWVVSATSGTLRSSLTTRIDRATSKPSATTM